MERARKNTKTGASANYDTITYSTIYLYEICSLAIEVITEPRVVKLILLYPLQPNCLVYPLSSFLRRKQGVFASHVGAAPARMHANEALLFLQVLSA